MYRSLQERERVSMGLSVSNDSIMNTSMQTEIRHFFKLIILGNVSVGKTSILKQFIEEKFEDKYDCTISADFSVKSMLIDHNTWVEMNIWDTCGQERYRTITRQYFKDAKGIFS
jgi:small GTP-binding protein